MSLLFTDDKNEMILTCDCGCCNAFHIVLYREDSDYFGLLTFMKNDWITEYYKNPWRSFLVKLKKIWFVLRGKDYCYSDTLMREADFLKFREYIDSIHAEKTYQSQHLKKNNSTTR